MKLGKGKIRNSQKNFVEEKTYKDHTFKVFDKQEMK
jgi:hypothetical protein